MGSADFWNNQEAAQGMVQEVKALKNWVEPFEGLVARVKSARELSELLELEPDDEMQREVAGEVERISADLEEYRLRSLLSHPDDFRDAQLEISAGAGGTEAQDWASMIMRMYTRWAERKGYTVEIVDLSEGEEAGIKGALSPLAMKPHRTLPVYGSPNSANEAEASSSTPASTCPSVALTSSAK